MSNKFDFSKEISELKNLMDEAYKLHDEELSDELGFDISEFNDDNQFFGDGKITVKFVSNNDKTLHYAYESDSGFDLYSNEEVIIPPFGRALIPTGVFFDLPQDFEIQVRSKSGLALKSGVMVLNSPGTVDQGYTGEIQVILFNTTNQKIKIEKNQKIAQAVLWPVVSGKWIHFIEKELINSFDKNGIKIKFNGICV